VEAGLLREELLMAEACVTVSGMDVTIQCFDDVRPKEDGCGDGIRGRWVRAPLSISSEERVERIGEVMVVTVAGGGGEGHNGSRSGTSLSGRANRVEELGGGRTRGYVIEGGGRLR
jgi:hypothetical protein